MRPEAIFFPMTVLALWTGFVLFLTGFQRIRAIAAGRVSRNAFRFGDGAEVPPEIRAYNQNLMNLLEMPVLFYVVCIAMYVTAQLSTSSFWLAWIFVAMRLVHSLVHLTTNNVVHRLIPFALSNLALLAMWIRFATRLL
jgi:hypothetical protein